MITDVTKKTRKKNFRASTENISSKATSNTISDSTADNRAGAMKASSTHEFIKDLPELDEGKTTNNESEQNSEEKEHESNKVSKSSAHVTVIDFCLLGLLVDICMKIYLMRFRKLKKNTKYLKQIMIRKKNKLKTLPISKVQMQMSLLKKKLMILQKNLKIMKRQEKIM